VRQVGYYQEFVDTNLTVTSLQVSITVSSHTYLVIRVRLYSVILYIHTTGLYVLRHAPFWMVYYSVYTSRKAHVQVVVLALY